MDDRIYDEIARKHGGIEQDQFDGFEDLMKGGSGGEGSD
jgi:hypothetical protein